MRNSFRLASLSLLGWLACSATAAAQGAPPAGPPPPPGGAAAGPPPAGGGAAPAGDPAWSFSADFDSDTGGDVSADGPAASDGDFDSQWRKESLQIQNSLSGSTGLLRVVEAGSGREGTFRVNFLSSWFTGSGVICDGTNDCPNEDEVTHIGAHLTISATPVPFLEGYLGLHSHATSNDQGSPKLLQVLGDTSLGVKLFMPREPDSLFTAGGDLSLWLLNGTGAVGVEGGGTSFNIKGVTTLDFNNATNPDDRIPLRLHGNLGYLFDNSGNLVEDTETNRGDFPITRIERFGLDINKVDSFQIGLGVEGVFEIIRPFLEYTVDVPVNRQNYVCNRNRTFGDDKCLGDESSFSATPSRLSIGARLYPWLEGLAFTGAFDVGTGATSNFIEEVAPELPWQLYFGFAYAVDVEGRGEPEIREVEVERVVQIPPPPQYFIEGVVKEKGAETTIADAIVKYEGRAATGMVTDAQGKFKTSNLQPGTYTFNVTADGYKPGTCSGTIAAGPPPGGGFGAPPPGPGAPPAGPPGTAPGAPPPAGPPPAGPPPAGPPPFGTKRAPVDTSSALAKQPPPGPGFSPGPAPPPGPPGSAPPGAPPPGAAPPPSGPPAPAAGPGFGGPAAAGPGAAPTGPTIVNIVCELEALPKVGNVIGSVVDAESSAAVAGAKIKITDNLDRELELSGDAAGAFRFENVPIGAVKLTITAAGYLPNVTKLEVKGREDVRASISLNKQPKRPNVVVTGKELKLKKKVHFQHDSADILPDSMAIIQEAASVLNQRQEIQLLEIQGHTDNTGTPAYNLRLSGQRAGAVRDALIELGVSSNRLIAKGYGQEKPLVPNVSDRNRARNRRVQLIIKKRQ